MRHHAPAARRPRTGRHALGVPRRRPGHHALGAPRRRTGRRRALAALAVAVAVAAGCGDDDARPDPARSGTLLARAAGASALEPLPGGGLRFGELGGRIRDVTRGGEVRDVARIDVSLGGQRGLLGIAYEGRFTYYVAYTEPAPPRRVVVRRVVPGNSRLIWRGPPSTDLANGGHIELAPDGRLTIGIGDLQDPAAVDDPGTPNGKLLALDTDGRPDQEPDVLSGGWNNPYAFAWTPGGELWVADNAPGERPERIARADPGGRDRPARNLAERIAPAGLAALGDDELLLCGFLSRRIDRISISGRGPADLERPPLATDCTLGVAPLSDGRIAYATRRAILVLAER